MKESKQTHYINRVIRNYTYKYNAYENKCPQVFESWVREYLKRIKGIRLNGLYVITNMVVMKVPICSYCQWNHYYCGESNKLIVSFSNNEVYKISLRNFKKFCRNNFG